MQMFVPRFASRSAACSCRHCCQHKQTAGLSTPHDDKTIMLRSRWQFRGGSFLHHAMAA